MSATTLEVRTRTVVLDGQPFGAAGAYEKITGILRFAADPAHEANAPITDLAHAPRNGSGHVESWANLDRWVAEGIDPPPSAVPRLAEGTAVPAESTAATFARIPGVRFPDHLGRPARLDFGPEVHQGVCAELPPKVGARYPAFVCAVDEDGNERAGITPVDVQVPLGTFTGWNPRHPAQGAPGDLMSMLGSTLPFARTRAERERTGDPRASIAERYPSRQAYLAKVRAAIRILVAARHMLEEDVEAVLDRAGRQWDLFQDGFGTP